MSEMLDVAGVALLAIGVGFLAHRALEAVWILMRYTSERRAERRRNRDEGA